MRKKRNWSELDKETAKNQKLYGKAKLNEPWGGTVESYIEAFIPLQKPIEDINAAAKSYVDKVTNAQQLEALRKQLDQVTPCRCSTGTVCFHHDRPIVKKKGAKLWVKART